MQAKSRHWGAGSVIDFPKRATINTGVKDVLKTAGFVPMPSTWNKSWHSSEVPLEQAQKLVESINEGKYDKRETIGTYKKAA